MSAVPRIAETDRMNPRLELFRTLVGFSDAISTLRDNIDNVSGKAVRVVLEGERGTGHEVVARAIHTRLGLARDEFSRARFVPVNCATVPAELQASELFGYAKGAFPGAVSAKRGRLELAAGGTLFIEECGMMAPAVQRAFAAALSTGTYTAVGDAEVQRLSRLHIIVSDIEGLAKRVERQEFDAELFTELSRHSISIPALRDRAQDIPLLLAEMSHRAELEGRGTVRFTSAVVEALKRHMWPGNGYELARLFEQCLLSHTHAVVDLDDLPERFRGRVVANDTADAEASSLSGSTAEVRAVSGDMRPEPASARDFHPPSFDTAMETTADGTVDMRDSVSKLESALIHWAMDASGGVVSSAAKRLCINRTTLVEKMRKYGISRNPASL